MQRHNFRRFLDLEDSIILYHLQVLNLWVTFWWTTAGKEMHMVACEKLTYSQELGWESFKAQPD